MSGQLQECRSGGREFQILGDAIEKLYERLYVVRANGTLAILEMDELRE